MADPRYSKLLSKIMEKAEGLRKEYSCSGITRDYIIVAAIQLLRDQERENPDNDEWNKALEIVRRYTTDNSELETVLEKWRNKELTLQEKIMVARHNDDAVKEAIEAHLSEVTADLYLAKLVKDETTSMIGLHSPDYKPSANRKREEHEKEMEERPSSPDNEGTSASSRSKVSSDSLSDIVEKARNLQINLQENILGQSNAISVFTAGFFHAELQAAIEKNRKRPRGTFLFAGPPGVGKTFLTEEAARILDLPFQRFDMSEYIGPNATDELAGSDANYRGSKEGLLTGFVAKNQQCILLFDEIEKASLEVIHLFLQILDAGRLRDNRTDKEVGFQDAILIFTTNAGKELYEGKNDENISLLSRDVVLDALRKEMNPKTNEPLFPAAICSRFASGNVVMFNHLQAHSLRKIAEKQLTTHTDNMAEAMKVSIKMDQRIPTALLLAEGASADARMVKSRTDAFFSGELYELYRLLPVCPEKITSEQIHEISFQIDLDHCKNEIRNLFIPTERMHVLAYAAQDPRLELQREDAPIVHYVSSYEECVSWIDNEKIEMLICDIDYQSSQSEKSYLNREDIQTPGRDFLLQILKKQPALPVVLLESKDHPMSDEEKESFYRKGVRGFVSLDETDEGNVFEEYLNEIFQQNSLSELGRANKILRFETAQKLNADKTRADIILFDLDLEKAIKGEDADNIMSLLSTPKERFDDIIGVEEAKKELAFFVTYMNNPRKYRRQGAEAPKGVLLYGPPGTGKTMLAKAFAAESGATFISTEGNQFFKGIVGQGAAMVHRLFAIARRYAPSVLFVDEIDAIARKRTGRDTDLAQDSEQILTAFFAEMDGFSTDTNKPVFVLGATNYDCDQNSRLSLDPAMLRRFDRRILIDLPNLESRVLYIRNQLKKKPIFQISEQEIRSLGERSTGMSLAQLASVMDLALRTAVQNNKDSIDNAALEEAFETFNGGEKKEWNQDIVLRTARHEAGHAVISWLAGEKPAYITIVSRGNYGGYVQHSDQEERFEYTKTELINRIATSLGGRAAELVYYGKEEGISTGASGDLRTATELAKRMLCEYGMDRDYGMAVIDPNQVFQSPRIHQRVNKILEEQLNAAVQKINENRDKIDTLVDKLLQLNHLNKDEIDAVLSNESTDGK